MASLVLFKTNLLILFYLRKNLEHITGLTPERPNIVHVLVITLNLVEIIQSSKSLC